MGLTNTKIKVDETWLNDWKLVEFLGSGSYGGVYKAVRNKTNEKSAMKLTYLPKYYDAAKEKKERLKTLKEFQIVQDKQHMNIVNVYQHSEVQFQRDQLNWVLKNVAEPKDTLTKIKADLVKNNLDVHALDESGVNLLFIRMELCGQNLRQWLDTTELQDRDLWTAQSQIINGIVEGLKFLHGYKILHRDLKSENIFLALGSDNGCHAKIGDFGISRIIHSEETRTSTLTKKPQTTRLYKAPELNADDGGYTLQADLYSLGLIIYEILNLLKSSHFIDDIQIFKSSRTDTDVPAEPFENARDVILRLTETDPIKRYQTIEQVQLSFSDSFKIVLESREYSGMEFMVLLCNIFITGHLGGGTVITEKCSILLDNRIIEEVQFKSSLTLWTDGNKLSKVKLNSCNTRDVLSNQILNCSEYTLSLKGDMNIISNITADGYCEIHVFGSCNCIKSFTIPDLKIRFNGGTNSSLENVKCDFIDISEGSNHSFRNVEFNSLQVSGIGHTYYQCKGRVVRSTYSKYAFVECSLEILDL